jgi:hypothetical protein
MNKNPFEIRTELLQLSKEILFNAASASAKRDDKGNILEISAPTTDEIMENARKLNKFVSGQ